MSSHEDNKKHLKSILNSSLKQSGFQRYGRVWTLECEDVTFVIGLRHIQFGHSYSLDVGVWLNQFGELIVRDPFLCQLHIQLESLFPDERVLIMKALTLDKASKPDIDQFQGFIQTQLIPYLYSLREYQILRDDVVGGHLSGAGKLAGVREYFDLP